MARDTVGMFRETPPVLTRRETLLGLSGLSVVFATTLAEQILSKLAVKRVFSEVKSASSVLVKKDEGNFYVLRVTSVPNHPIGLFPNPNCPSKLRPQPFVFQIPKNTSIAPHPTPIGASLFGVAVNGVVFDPAGPYWKQRMDLGWQYEVTSPLGRQFLGLDMNNAHVQHSGEYHYHGLPEGLIQALLVDRNRAGDAFGKMLLVGWAADGFPIYAPWGHAVHEDGRSPLVPMRSSYRLLTGLRGSGPKGSRDGTFVRDYEYVAGSGDLDECNGRFGVTPEFPEGTFHYFLTHQFPCVSRLYKGTPHSSFAKEPRVLARAPVPPGLAKIFK